MTKEELINKISEDTGLLKITVSSVLEQVIDNISNAVAKGERVQFTNFGTFDVKTTAAKVGYDFISKSNINIPKRVIPIFKPGKAFKEAVAKQPIPKGDKQ